MLKSFLKIAVIWLIIALILGIAGSWIYYQKKKQDWVKHKQQIENQKAEEITIRIVEGWSNKEIAKYLELQGIVSTDIFFESIKNFDFSKYESILPIETAGDLQGFLYPDTYRLFKSITDPKITPAKQAAQTVIAKLVNTFEKRLPENAAQLANKQGLSLYESIILASIVEKETGRNAITAKDKINLDEERKIVAGIFLNRLRAKMALQSDATINYITGKNDPAVSLKDLEINSPYNTYKNRGLPPSPISNPSLSSILAVLNPISTAYFYFLHKQPSGEPVYSKTFEEHVANKFKFLK